MMYQCSGSAGDDTECAQRDAYGNADGHGHPQARTKLMPPADTWLALIATAISEGSATVVEKPIATANR